PLESVLTGATEDDRARVKTIIPTLDYVTKPGDVEATRGEGPITQEVWWLVLLLLLGVLFAEGLYTRGLARRGLPADL
ncbi:MAG: hypothetical protein ACRCZF_01485, partial [Gemmataceae bacterium]